MPSLLDPAVLFFVFGVCAGLLRSNLEIPRPIAQFLSFYLLMALGLKGGFALAATGLQAGVLVSLGLAFLLAAIVPCLAYGFLRRHVPVLDAAAIAAAYGSVSAVTFVTAMHSLDGQGLQPGGHMSAALVIMESPAVIFAVALASRLRRDGHHEAVNAPGLGQVLRESFTHGPQLLLLGAMAIGWLTGEAGKAMMQPFSIDLFKGMLAFFLLDMGLQASRHLGSLRGHSPWLLAYAVLGPVAHSMIALGLAMLLGISAGNAALLMVLAASASYIAVPAVVRHAIPEANPSLYFGMSLGVTFPLNILVGIPLYVSIAHRVLG